MLHWKFWITLKGRKGSSYCPGSRPEALRGWILCHSHTGSKSPNQTLSFYSWSNTISIPLFHSGWFLTGPEVSTSIVEILVKRRNWLSLPSFGYFLPPFLSQSKKNGVLGWLQTVSPSTAFPFLSSWQESRVIRGPSPSWGVKGLCSACRWMANGLSWVVSMKGSHNLILKWKPWVKLSSLFHQAHQGLPFPLWKLYFMQCISNPSVTSISSSG